MSWINKSIKFIVICIINFVLTVFFLEWALQFYLLGSLPSYFIAGHYPNQKVHAVAEEINSKWVSNSQGFNDVERKFTKGKGVFRIIVIGDSFLDGPQNVPLSLKLESKLSHRTSKKVEVINLSRPGIDPDVYSLLLKHALLKYEPDLIINFIFTGNDFRGAEKIDYSKLIHNSYGFYSKYPNRSIVSDLFPRISIVVAAYLNGDIANKKILNQYMQFPEHVRWYPHKPKSLDEVSKEIVKYIHAAPLDVMDYLIERLPSEELDYLTSYGVRLDLIAYMLGVGMQKDFQSRLNIKGVGRPELLSQDIENQQVINLFEFIKSSSILASSYDVDYATAIIPTSIIDEKAAEVYRLIGADNDPLFYRVRLRQEKLLVQFLLNSNIKSFNLSDSLRGLSGTYLRYDTHWSEKRVDVVSEFLATQVYEHNQNLK